MFDTSERGESSYSQKNIREFEGFPAIGSTIKTVKSTRLFDDIFVSTDNKEIAEISEAYGATVPWLRSSALSDDFTDTDTVLFQGTKKLCKLLVTFSTLAVFTQLLTKELIVEGLNLLQKLNALSAFPVVEYDFPIQQALQLNDGQPVFIDKDAIEARSQDLTQHTMMRECFTGML